MSLADLQSDFDLLDDWEDRYRYVIELGRALPVLPDAFRSEATKVRGCASQVWLVTNALEPEKGGGSKMTMLGASDALIVQGLIAVLFEIYKDKTAGEIANLDAHAIFGSLGFKEHLTQQRSNGLASMVARIQADARAVSAGA